MAIRWSECVLLRFFFFSVCICVCVSVCSPGMTSKGFVRMRHLFDDYKVRVHRASPTGRLSLSLPLSSLDESR